MDCNKPMKKIFLMSLFFVVASVFATTTVNTDSAVQTLNQLDQSPTQFPSCSEKDGYWIYQSGSDKVVPNPVNSQATIISADSVTGQESGVHFAQGHVVGYKGDKTIVADWLTYDQHSNHATGGDHIVLTRQYDEIKGRWVDYYMDLDKGTILDATAYQEKSQMYAQGKKIDVLNKKKYVIYNGYLTTCDPKHPDWHFRSSQTTFDYQNSEGNARHVVFYAESLPLFYLPYLQFPLGERKSGFLTPEFGNTVSPYGNSSGFMFGIPYYWNMAPDYDMTIEPKYYTNDGFMITDQFRYLTPHGKGEIYTEQVPSDYSTESSPYRYYWHILDDHTPVKDVHVGYDYNSVSDNNYFVTFGNFYSTVDNINLDRSVYTNYTPDWGNFGIKAQGYQVLQPQGGPPTVQIYSMLPQVNLNVNPYRLGDTWFKGNLISQYTNFTSNSTQLQPGQRTYFYPSVTMPLQNSWGFVTPKIGYNLTNYQIAPLNGFNSNFQNVNRQLPITSLDSGLVFERPVNWGDSSYAQTLEPRLYYLYIPQVNQANLPVFDTATTTYNLNQLFSENHFSGYDRINMANDLTMGLSSKLFNDNTGNQLYNFGMGYRYHITPENNSIYGTQSQYGQLFLPQPDFVTELSNNWAKSIATNANFQYSSVSGNVIAYNLQMKYNPEDYKIFNVRYSYQYQMPLLFYAYVPGQQFAPNGYENQYALDVSGQWPIFANRWLLEGRVNYDFTAQQLLNFLGGIEYNGGCWSIRAIVENYVNALGYNQPGVNNYTQLYFIQFNLKGIANLGTDPNGDLRVNIPGYMPMNGVAPFNGIH